jgi:hypothetical protein
MTAPTTVNFGGAGGSGFTGFFPLTSTPIALPSGRAMASGNTSAGIMFLAALISGNGGTRTGSISLAGASVTFSAASSGTPVNNGGPTSLTICNGGTGTLSITASGSLNFGRTGTGTTTDGHTAFGGVIGGYYEYVQAPVAPTIGTVTSTALGSATVAFTPSTDDGGSAISTHRIEYSTDGFATVAGYAESTSSPATITGLAPGVVYSFRVAARNAMTDALGTVSAYSSVGSVTILGGVKVGKAGAWVTCAVYAGINGQWVPVQVYAGRAGAWVGLTT